MIKTLKFVGGAFKAYAFSMCPGLHGLSYLFHRTLLRVQSWLWPCGTIYVQWPEPPNGLPRIGSIVNYPGLYHCHFPAGHAGKHRANYGHGHWVEWDGKGTYADNVEYTPKPCL